MDDPRPAESPPGPGPHRLAAAVVIATSLAIDQLTKAMARALLQEGQRISLLGDVFRLELIRNAGAFLSLGADLPPAVRGPLLTWGVLALSAGAAWFALFRREPLALTLAMALVAGGGFGNLWDRIAADGHVTDFLNLGIGRLRTGIFNVADLAIVAGVVLFVLPRRSEPT